MANANDLYMYPGINCLKGKTMKQIIAPNIVFMSSAKDELSSVDDRRFSPISSSSQHANPVTYITKAALKHWLESDGGPRQYTFLKTGNDMRIGLYLAAPPAQQTSAQALGQQERDDADFYRGVIAALGVLTGHGHPHGSTYHDEIVNSVGADALYSVAEPEDFQWAGLDATRATKEGGKQ